MSSNNHLVDSFEGANTTTAAKQFNGAQSAQENEITDCQDQDRADHQDHRRPAAATSSGNQHRRGLGRASSGGQSLLSHNSVINSGPMSEGHVRLYQNDTRPSDPSQNICLFTPCLFLVGAAMLSFGVMFYIRFKLAWVGLFFCVMGTFSAGSAVLYTLLYVIMIGLRKSSLKHEEASTRGNRNLSHYAPDESVSGTLEGFDQFGDFDNPSQSNGLHNGEHDVVNEGSGLCGSNYVPASTETVQLNVDNLDFEIKSTQNLDVSAWRTLNGDLPQSYLESFGELPSDLLSSPSLKKGLDRAGEFGNRHSSKKGRKRGRIFDSLRNGSQAFAIKANQKSSSQTELLDSENESENTLFHIESIGQELESPAGTSDAFEKVTVENGGGHNAAIVVHFNKSSNNLIDTFN